MKMYKMQIIKLIIIINKNENVQDANYKAYYNNILSFLEINKDLNSSIIK